MALQNDYTTKEQSDRLLRLGLPRISANLYYDDEDELQLVRDKEHELIERGYFPCWSVGRLVEIYHICVSRGFSFNVCFPNLMNEIMYKLGEANSNGWLDLKKLEE